MFLERLTGNWPVAELPQTLLIQHLHRNPCMRRFACALSCVSTGQMTSAWELVGLPVTQAMLRVGRCLCARAAVR